MKTRTAIAICLMAGTSSVTAQASDYSDPTWPCVQRKVETLSIGLMWPLPLDPAAEPDSGEMGEQITELAGYLSLRRVELDSLQPRIAAFAEAHDGNAQALGLVFARVFDTLSKRRSRIVHGIEDFSLGQVALAEKIDGARAEMDTVLAQTEPDHDQADRLEEQLDWDQMIYSDRQRNIVYLCETPVLLERRLFSIAQLLHQAVAKDD